MLLIESCVLFEAKCHKSQNFIGTFRVPLRVGFRTLYVVPDDLRSFRKFLIIPLSFQPVGIHPTAGPMSSLREGPEFPRGPSGDEEIHTHDRISS